MITAEWTGKYPNLCSGKWKLYIDGEDYSCHVFSSGPMNTYGTYRRWHFENWHEVWEEYQDGLQEEEWIKAHKDWLKMLPIEPDRYPEVFKAFQEHDWRFGSCGGCI